MPVVVGARSVLVWADPNTLAQIFLGIYLQFWCGCGLGWYYWLPRCCSLLLLLCSAPPRPAATERWKGFVSAYTSMYSPSLREPGLGLWRIAASHLPREAAAHSGWGPSHQSQQSFTDTATAQSDCSTSQLRLPLPR